MKVIIGMGNINCWGLTVKRWVVRITWDCNGGRFKGLEGIDVRGNEIKKLP